MNLTIQANWTINQQDRDFVKDNFIRPKFNQAAVAVRKCFPNTPSNPFDAFRGSLLVKLYGDSTPDGTAGQYISVPGPSIWGFDDPDANCLVNVAWNIIWNRGHRILEHEFRHMLAHMACGSGNFGHGDPADPNIIRLKTQPVSNMSEELEDVYHTNTDKPYPDVYLCHCDAPLVHL